MATIRTHYDNLKVTRDAPDEVLLAAYKALIQKYQPDTFKGTEQEELQIAKLIKHSYEVLIDPDKRAEYDRWIDDQEMKAKQESKKAQFEEVGEATEQQCLQQTRRKAREDNIKQQQKLNTQREYTPPPQSPPQPRSYAPVTSQLNVFLRYVFVILACLVLLLIFGLMNKFVVQGFWGGAIAGGIYVYALAFTWRAITKKSVVDQKQDTQRKNTQHPIDNAETTWVGSYENYKERERKHKRKHLLISRVTSCLMAALCFMLMLQASMVWQLNQQMRRALLLGMKRSNWLKLMDRVGICRPRMS